MLAQETGEVFLCCLTISHPTLSAPFYLVNDYNSLARTVNGAPVSFEPFAFDVSLPNEQEDQLPQVSVTIDNIDNAILVAIRNIPGERPKIRLEVLLASQPDTIEAGPFDFSILNINYTDASIQGAIGFEDDLLNTAFPADTYTPTNSRGLFV